MNSMYRMFTHYRKWQNVWFLFHWAQKEEERTHAAWSVTETNVSNRASTGTYIHFHWNVIVLVGSVIERTHSVLVVSFLFVFNGGADKELTFNLNWFSLLSTVRSVVLLFTHVFLLFFPHFRIWLAHANARILDAILSLNRNLWVVRMANYQNAKKRPTRKNKRFSIFRWCRDDLCVNMELFMFWRWTQSDSKKQQNKWNKRRSLKSIDLQRIRYPKYKTLTTQ